MTRPYDTFGHPVYIGVNHYRIHEGNSFVAGQLWGESYSTSLIADNGSAVVVIEPNDAMHTIMTVAAGGDCEVIHYTGTSASTTGESIPIFNKNSYSNKTSSTVMSFGTTALVSDFGTAYPGHHLPGGSGGNAVGNIAGIYNRETIMMAGVKYSTRVINRSGGAIPISIIYEWYEPKASS